MPRDFYPFVEKDHEEDGNAPDEPVVEHPARIAVYDDVASAPRVVMIEPQDVRSYLEEITSTVSRLVREQGGTIPFMVIREIVENFIHAYFQAPTITILDGGNTIRFSDQGPGIREKSLALEYGTSSATEGMKRYIRGVGSGLPYVQQYMVDKGGSLDIEDNIAGGTVVTISTRPQEDARATANAEITPDEAAPAAWGQPVWPQQGGASWPQQPAWGQAPAQQPSWPAYPAAAGWAQGAVPAPMPGAPVAGAGAPGQAFPQQPFPQQPWPAQQPAAPAAPAPAPVTPLDERARQALAHLAARGEAGPSDLTQAFGQSASSWSRTLQTLARMGAVTKGAQKYRLTEYGHALAASS